MKSGRFNKGTQRVLQTRSIKGLFPFLIHLFGKRGWRIRSVDGEETLSRTDI